MTSAQQARIKAMFKAVLTYLKIYKPKSTPEAETVYEIASEVYESMKKDKNP